MITYIIYICVRACFFLCVCIYIYIYIYIYVKYYFVGIIKESVKELNGTLNCDILKKPFFQL